VATTFYADHPNLIQQMTLQTWNMYLIITLFINHFLLLTNGVRRNLLAQRNYKNRRNWYYWFNEVIRGDQANMHEGRKRVDASGQSRHGHRDVADDPTG
jgi:hypothetical protein